MTSALASANKSPAPEAASRQPPPDSPPVLDESRLFLIEQQAMQEHFLLRVGQLSLMIAHDPSDARPCEDAAAALRAGPRHWVLAVADGVGGVPGGGVASELALMALQDALAGLDAADEPVQPGPAQVRSAILDGIERANRAVLDLGTGAATTLAVVEVGPDYVRPYHVGDSGIVLVGQRGRLKLQTIAHSPVGFAVEAGLLDEDEAIHHEMLHVISNVIGDPDMRIEVGSELPIAARDTLLLATDGLLDNMLPEEVRSVIRRGPLPDALARLSATVLRRMRGRDAGKPSKPDDCTILLFRPHSPGSERQWRALEPGTIDWLGQAQTPAQ